MKHKNKFLECKANIYLEYFKFLLNNFGRSLVMVREDPKSKLSLPNKYVFVFGDGLLTNTLILWKFRCFYSGIYRSISFGGLGVACWPSVPKFAGSNPAEAVGFLGRKNPQHTFLNPPGSHVFVYRNSFKRLQLLYVERNFTVTLYIPYLNSTTLLGKSFSGFIWNFWTALLLTEFRKFNKTCRPMFYSNIQIYYSI
jgi:hypothetical protein